MTPPLLLDSPSSCFYSLSPFRLQVSGRKQSGHRDIISLTVKADKRNERAKKQCLVFFPCLADFARNHATHDSLEISTVYSPIAISKDSFFSVVFRTRIWLTLRSDSCAGSLEAARLTRSLPPLPLARGAGASPLQSSHRIREEGCSESQALIAS